MAFGERKSERVDFERGIHVYIMGIDGTWRRDCMMVDVSQTGARLRVEGSLEGLDLKEFFLLLSSTGLAYRRCSLVRLSGDQIGVGFLARDKNAKRKAPQNSGPRTKSFETIPDFGPLINAIQPVWRTYRTGRSLSLRRSSSTFAINLADPAIFDCPNSQEPQRSR
jgi:hypothetical protein